MKHIISMLIENESGALSRVSGLFSARGYNIHALTVAPTEDDSLSRLTLVTSGTSLEVEQIVKQGYEIGNLGYAYSDYTDMEPNKIKQDILKADTVFKKLNVKDVKLLRVPTGHFNKETLTVADSLGRTVVHWRVDSKDWTNPGVDEIINNVKKAKKGDIILLHASDSAKQTKSALPTIVKELKGKGNFITVSDMISNGDAESSLIQ